MKRFQNTTLTLGQMKYGPKEEIIKQKSKDFHELWNKNMGSEREMCQS